MNTNDIPAGYLERQEKLAKMREYSANMREQRKKNRQCVACGTQDGRTLEGYRMCRKCAIENADYQRYHRHRRKAQNAR